MEGKIKVWTINVIGLYFIPTIFIEQLIYIRNPVQRAKDKLFIKINTAVVMISEGVVM